MARIAPALAALLLAVTASAPAVAAAPRSEAPRAVTTTRFGQGEASATISVRIIRASALVGHGLGPPAPAMVPRRATVTAADGSAVAALVYDFE